MTWSMVVTTAKRRIWFNYLRAFVGCRQRYCWGELYCVLRYRNKTRRLATSSTNDPLQLGFWLRGKIARGAQSVSY